jgi:hypothetical protein
MDHCDVILVKFENLQLWQVVKCVWVDHYDFIIAKIETLQL